jgi:ABC-type Fe3+-hydroxamate transport system substrate-binding protein
LLTLVAVAVLAVASIAIAARGGEEEKKPNKGADLTAIKCPLEPTGATADSGEPEYRPAKDAFDTAELLGLKLADARKKASEKRCEIVVSVKDGAGQPVPIEIDPKRIYVYTEKDVVTQIEGVGGGI